LKRAESFSVKSTCLRTFNLSPSSSPSFYLDSADLWACRDIGSKRSPLVGIGRGEPIASKIAATRFNEGNASLRLAAVFPRLPGRVDTNSTSAVIWWRDLRGAEGEGEGEGVIEFYKGKRINGENASTRSQRSSLDWWRCCSGYLEMTCVHVSCEHERACLSAFHEFVWVLTLSLLYYATIANWLIFSFFRFTKLSIFQHDLSNDLFILSMRLVIWSLLDFSTVTENRKRLRRL